MSQPTDPKFQGGPVDQQPTAQAGQQQVRVSIDERNLKTTYANAFRTHGTAEEVLVDFGINLAVPPVGQDGPQTPQVVLQITERIVLNYYSAKRLAITLGQLVRRHEEQFGDLELDASKRRKDGQGPRLA